MDESIEDHTLDDATEDYGDKGGPEANDDGSEIKGKRDLDGAEDTGELQATLNHCFFFEVWEERYQILLPPSPHSIADLKNILGMYGQAAPKI
ncbi:hypothetical protein EDD11_002468 [Mortierella claussenii]|nr:hypothetical protein EDD11_002468 [Mortierella claussenii]